MKNIKDIDLKSNDFTYNCKIMADREVLIIDLGDSIYNLFLGETYNNKLEALIVITGPRREILHYPLAQDDARSVALVGTELCKKHIAPSSDIDFINFVLDELCSLIKMENAILDFDIKKLKTAIVLTAQDSLTSLDILLSNNV